MYGAKHYKSFYYLPFDELPPFLLFRAAEKRFNLTQRWYVIAPIERRGTEGSSLASTRSPRPRRRFPNITIRCTLFGSSSLLPIYWVITDNAEMSFFKWKQGCICTHMLIKSTLIVDNANKVM